MATVNVAVATVNAAVATTRRFGVSFFSLRLSSSFLLPLAVQLAPENPRVKSRSWKREAKSGKREAGSGKQDGKRQNRKR